MPKDSAGGQPETGYQPPAWLGPVKVAVAVMSALIVLGVALLVYGFAIGIKELDSGHPPVTLNYPAGQEPAGVSATADGEVVILFRNTAGTFPVWHAVTVDPESRRVTGRITLLPGSADFEIDE